MQISTSNTPGYTTHVKFDNIKFTDNSGKEVSMRGYSKDQWKKVDIFTKIACWFNHKTATVELKKDDGSTAKYVLVKSSLIKQYPEHKKEIQKDIVGFIKKMAREVNAKDGGKEIQNTDIHELAQKQHLSPKDESKLQKAAEDGQDATKTLKDLQIPVTEQHAEPVEQDDNPSAAKWASQPTPGTRREPTAGAHRTPASTESASRQPTPPPRPTGEYPEALTRTTPPTRPSTPQPSPRASGAPSTEHFATPPGSPARTSSPRAATPTPPPSPRAPSPRAPSPRPEAPAAPAQPSPRTMAAAEAARKEGEHDMRREEILTLKLTGSNPNDRAEQLRGTHNPLYDAAVQANANPKFARILLGQIAGELKPGQEYNMAKRDASSVLNTVKYTLKSDETRAMFDALWAKAKQKS